MNIDTFTPSYFSEEQPAALVVSHERSGTHFLMNSLATCYGYVSQPWVNLDQPDSNVHYSYPQAIGNYLLTMAAQPLRNTVKSHHSVDFFEGILPGLAQRYVILAICRHPVPLLVSLWRFFHRWPLEGPAVADPLVLARGEPWGGMLRFQKRQYPNVVQRWAAHVEGWLAAAQAHPHVLMIRYEDLDTNYETTVRALSPLLGRPPAMTRPARNTHIIATGPEDPTGAGPPDMQALESFCRDQVGPTMARLGY